MLRQAASFASLSKPEHRLLVWLVASMFIFFTPITWFNDLSLLKRLGWESAPSIGLTRAYWLTMHGRIADAYEMNRLIFAVLAVGLPMLAADAKALYANWRNK